MPRGWASPSTSIEIREQLKKGPMTSSAIVEVFEVDYEDTDYTLPDRQSISQILRCCRKLGLVEVVDTKPGNRNPNFEKKVYSLVENKIDAPEWRDPVTAHYNPDKFNAELPTAPPQEKIEEHMEKMRETQRELLEKGEIEVGRPTE